MEKFKGRDIISIKDLSRTEIEYIFENAKKMERIATSGSKICLLQDKILATLFFEPSTRTRLSFEAAMHRLGGSVFGFADPKTTRAGDVTHERLEDTARMINYYADVAAIRHFEDGAAAKFAEVVDIPVLNAGDGHNEHPTQALGDLYTIAKEKGKIDGLKVLMIGKTTRSLHSLGYGLAKFNGTHVYHLSPENVRIPAHVKNEFRNLGLNFEEIAKLDVVINDVDVIYMINVLTYEAGMHEKKTPDKYRLDLTKLKKAKEDLIILHPLPRQDELPTNIDNTPYAKYFVQAFNGLVVRMALLALVLGRVP